MARFARPSLALRSPFAAKNYFFSKMTEIEKIYNRILKKKVTENEKKYDRKVF
jgi:hypothetical protein